MSMTQVPPEVKDISVSSMESTTVPVQHAIVSETQLPTSPVSGALPPRTADSSAKVEGSGLKARRTEMSSMPLSRKGEEDVEAGGRSNHRRKISEDLSLHKGDQEERLDNRSAVSSAHARSWLGRQADSMSILFSELATMMRYWNDDTSLRGYAAQLAFASIGIVAGVVGWTFYGSLLLLTAALDSCCHASQVFVYLYSAFLCAKRRDPLFTYGMERAEVVLTFASSVSIGFMSFFAMFDGLSALMSGEVGEASAVPFLALATFAVNTFSTLFLRSIPPRAFISSAGVKGKSSGALGAGDGISPLRALYEFSGSEALVKRLKELNREAFTFAAFNIALNLAVLLISVVEEFQASSQLDVAVTMIFAAHCIKSVGPMFSESGHILLQATPKSYSTRIDKAMREAANVDDVLEIKRSHFWTAAPGMVVGSLKLRARGSADNAMIIENVRRRFDSLLSELTVEVDKDEV